MTGILPPPTGGAAIPGSMPAGGQIIPFDRDNWSLRLAPPVVSPGTGSAPRWHSGVDGVGGSTGVCACAGADGIPTHVASNVAARLSVRMSDTPDALRCTKQQDGTLLGSAIWPFRPTEQADSFARCHPAPTATFRPDHDARHQAAGRPWLGPQVRRDGEVVRLFTRRVKTGAHVAPFGSSPKPSVTAMVPSDTVH
jgi:hypothetical protein